MERLLSHIDRQRRCIDDTLLYDETIKEAFFRACEFLDTCGNNGVILNPGKFKFAERDVDFLGFTVSDSGVKPHGCEELVWRHSTDLVHLCFQPSDASLQAPLVKQDPLLLVTRAGASVQGVQAGGGEAVRDGSQDLQPSFAYSTSH